MALGSSSPPGLNEVNRHLELQPPQEDPHVAAVLANCELGHRSVEHANETVGVLGRGNERIDVLRSAPREEAPHRRAL